MEASGRWFVSLLLCEHTVKLLPEVNKAVVINAGITSLVTTSDGEKISNPKHFKRHRYKLRQAHRKLSRRAKGSNNREKARREVAKIQAAIADSRKDFLTRFAASASLTQADTDSRAK